MRVRCAATLSVVAAVVIGACSSESGVSLDQEVDQVRIRIASCLVIERDDGHRHNVTVEIYNQSESTWDVTVSLGAEGDLTGTSDTLWVAPIRLCIVGSTTGGARAATASRRSRGSAPRSARTAAGRCRG
jgi:hypothetical protein